ncbi:hypothetical protein GIB67_015941 [Kingdonia uniflora]|uniref:Uncharacterized protein n=1 Tax=Kingdonia uniflora TaxID=39325 RepID=A0A7J7PCC0_9MAGN|nr:hypothetical protein GIB67_015941 [Kingdonia uniflora]
MQNLLKRINGCIMDEKSSKPKAKLGSLSGVNFDLLRFIHCDFPKNLPTPLALTRILLVPLYGDGDRRYSLDIPARAPLWKSGLDYRHGTGHEIGSYLNVYEGHIRLENVFIVNEANPKFNFGDNGYLSFEHITWAVRYSPPPDGARGRSSIMKEIYSRTIAYKSIQLSGLAPEGFYRVIVDEVILDDM